MHQQTCVNKRARADGHKVVTHFFLRIPFSFSVPVHSTLPRQSSSPNPLFPKPQIYFFSREKETCRGWVLRTVLDGVAPQAQKGKSFFLWCARKGEVRDEGFLPWPNAHQPCMCSLLVKSGFSFIELQTYNRICTARFE